MFVIARPGFPSGLVLTNDSFIIASYVLPEIIAKRKAPLPRFYQEILFVFSDSQQFLLTILPLSLPTPSLEPKLGETVFVFFSIRVRYQRS